MVGQNIAYTDTGTKLRRGWANFDFDLPRLYLQALRPFFESQGFETNARRPCPSVKSTSEEESKSTCVMAEIQLTWTL